MRDKSPTRDFGRGQNFLSVPGGAGGQGRNRSPSVGAYSNTSRVSDFSDLTDEVSRSNSPSDNRGRSPSPGNIRLPSGKLH